MGFKLARRGTRLRWLLIEAPGRGDIFYLDLGKILMKAELMIPRNEIGYIHWNNPQLRF